jgi:hypothetical protein
MKMVYGVSIVRHEMKVVNFEGLPKFNGVGGKRFFEGGL